LKTYHFMDMVRKAAQVNRYIIVPGERTQRNWPLCLTCGREVEASELKNVNATSIEVWARCHGQEDFCRILFPFRIEGDPLEDERANWAIKRAMADFSPFDPTVPSK
jgi:hypothetical protein